MSEGKGELDKATFSVLQKLRSPKTRLSRYCMLQLQCGRLAQLARARL